MELVAQGRYLKDLPTIDAGEVRVYLGTAITEVQFQDAADIVAGLDIEGSDPTMTYDCRVLSFKFKQKDVVDAVRDMNFTLGWQLFGDVPAATGGVPWKWIGIGAGALALGFLATRRHHHPRRKK